MDSATNVYSIGKPAREIDNDILKPVESFPTKTWWVVFSIATTVMLIMWGIIGYTFKVGLGPLGINNPVGWGFYIINFVFWIGIGHAGTLISAILYLFRQRWRTTINRAAEAMTIFAVMTALLFPVIHLGRPWMVFFFFPYPNERGPIWPNFKSPLLWDVFAISTYFTVSLIFWFMGLVPDIATMRDRLNNQESDSKFGKIWLNFKRGVSNILSIGWVGSGKTWIHYEKMVLILAAMSTPLVFSVHSIVSMDFATSVIPGWHATIFPPYFVAGAIYSGFAMVMTLMIITREVFQLKQYITLKHLENMAIVILLTGMMVSFAYTIEFVIAAYSGNKIEQYAFLNRLKGPYAWGFWTMFTCNVVSPHFMWFKKLRTNIPFLFFITIVVNIGMWFERYVIVVISLHRDYIPSSWDLYSPTWVDYSVLIGSFGWFFFWYLLFVRILPQIAIAEVKADEYGDQVAKGMGH